MTDPDQRPDNDFAHTQGFGPGYQGQGCPSPDDEISLFDLWDSLVRRRWIILGVTALVTVLAAVYAMTRPDIYRYGASLRIGQTVLETKEGKLQRVPIAPPAEVTAQLRSSIIPATLRQVLGLDEEALASGGARIPDVQVSAAQGAGVVDVQIVGPANRGATYLDILWNVANRLVHDHADILSVERIRLTQKLERLKRNRSRVKSRLEGVQTRIDRLAKEGGTSESAVPLRIDGLQGRAAELQNRLLEIEAERDQTSDYLETIKENAAVFTGEFDAEAVADQQKAGNRIAAFSGGIRPTTVISLPERGLTQTGTSGLLIVALGLILGGMLGVFSGFVADFLAAARRRHQPTDKGMTIDREA